MDILDEDFGGLVLVTETRSNIDILLAGLQTARRMMDNGLDWEMIRQMLPVLIIKDVVPFNEAIKDHEVYIIDKQARRLGIAEILAYNSYTLLIYINDLKVVPLNDAKMNKLIAKYLPTTFAS